MVPELIALNRKISKTKTQVEGVVKDFYGEDRNLNMLTVRDRQRLTNLQVWSERHRVDVEWIVEILLEHYLGFIKTKKKRKGLGVRVATFMSQTSEQFLKDKLKELYPNGEHIQLWKQRERERIVKERLKDNDLDLVPPYRRTKQDSLKKYLDDYNQQIERRRTMWTRLMSRKFPRMEYRGSPWQ